MATARMLPWRTIAVVVLTFIWIAALHSSMGPAGRMGRQSRQVSEVKSLSWEVDDTPQLTSDLIAEVVEELDKAKEGSVSGTSFCGEAADAERKIEVQKPSSKLLPVGKSLHSLALHSVSRVSVTDFRAVGLVSVFLREQNGDPVGSCAWVSRASFESAATLVKLNHSSVNFGTSEMNYVNESKGEYDVTGLRCRFQDPVGANGEGGVLVLNVTSSATNFELVPVFQEMPEELNSIQFEGPFTFDYAYCSPPLNKNVSTEFISEWFMYHHSLWDGKVHYFVYDAGSLDSRLQKFLQPLLDAGLLTIVDFRQEAVGSDPEVLHQLAISDCLERSRFIASWALFWDFDEYFEVLDPGIESLGSLLRRFESRPWISLGTMSWSRIYCDEERQAEKVWGVERMNFRLRLPTCWEESRADFCHGVEGKRKWIANPRQVFMGTIHRTLDPEWNGEILNASLARLNHFDQLALDDSFREGGKNCWIVKNVEEQDESRAVDGWWWKDVSFARRARLARVRSLQLPVFNKSV